MQVYLGSLYVNDFNRFGRTYQVNAQADMPFRLEPDDILRSSRCATRRARWCRSARSSRSSRARARASSALQRLSESAEINGGPAPGSRPARREAADRGARGGRRCRTACDVDWTELAYQQLLAGNTAVWIFPLCVLLVFLVLAALYESWSLPLVVILIVPMC